jgi:hypothetical protein
MTYEIEMAGTTMAGKERRSESRCGGQDGLLRG